MKKDVVKVKGVVLEAFPGAKFLVKFEEYNSKAVCSVSGKLRQNKIRILEGDKVDIELSPYDLTVGRIVWRF